MDCHKIIFGSKYEGKSFVDLKHLLEAQDAEVHRWLHFCSSRALSINDQFTVFYNYIREHSNLPSGALPVLQSAQPEVVESNDEKSSDEEPEAVVESKSEKITDEELEKFFVKFGSWVLDRRLKDQDRK